jgi:hypothetical protein
MVFNIIRFKIYVTSYRHMTILIVAPFVVGVVLERFFKALVLFPTCMVVLMVVVVRAACVGHGLLNAILEFAVVITSLQIGYASTLVLAAVPRILQRVSSGHLHQKTVTRHRS